MWWESVGRETCTLKSRHSASARRPEIILCQLFFTRIYIQLFSSWDSIYSSQHLLFIKVYCFQDKINAIKLDQNLFIFRLLLSTSLLLNSTFVNVHQQREHFLLLWEKHSWLECSVRLETGYWVQRMEWCEWIKTRQKTPQVIMMMAEEK